MVIDYPYYYPFWFRISILLPLVVIDYLGFPNLTDLVETLLVGEDIKEYTKQVAPQAMNAPDDTSGFEFQRGPVLLVGESPSTDVDNGAN